MRLRESELAAAWADVTHAFRVFYELADILIVLDEVFLLEISNFARQLKFNPAIGDDHPIINHLTASLWFRSMELTITISTSKSRGPSNERKNVAATEKQLESMVYRPTQERGRWPFLTPRLENATEKTRENAPPLVKQIWSFLEEQLEVAESREMAVTRFVTAANEVTIGGFWKEHAKGELKTRRDHEILKFLSPCWGKEFMAGVFGAKETIFGAFVQEILSMPISLLLALYIVYPRYLFNMGPAYMFSRGVETLRIDGYLALVLLTHGELVSVHRLTKYGEPLSMGKTHSRFDTYSYKCAAGLKTPLVEYLLMQNRQMTGEEKNPKTKDEWRKVNGGMPLFIINHLTASLWFRSMELTITISTGKSRGPSNERKNVAATEKQLESMVYRLTQERGRWPFLTPRLENATEKTRENAPPLVKQIWSFLEEQLEVAESREMTVTRFVTAANEVTIGGFWKEHAKGELKTRRDHEILKFLSPCWGKEFMAGVFGAIETIFGAFVQEILSMPISLLLALYLVYPRYLFNMGPAYMFSRGVETLRIDGYLALVLLTHGELVSFHRLMKYGEPLSMGRTHSGIDTYSYKCAAGLKKLLVQYLLMQNRHLTGEEKSPKTRDE